MNGQLVWNGFGGSILALCLLFGPAVSLARGAQAAGPKAAASGPLAGTTKPAATPVEKVIDLTKSGLSEELLLRIITRDRLTSDLNSDEMLRLKRAGVSDKVVSAMMEPAAAVGASPPVPSAAAAPVATGNTADAAPTPSAVDVRAALPRAAIEEFDWSTVKTVVQEVFKTNVDVGKGVRALLTKRVQEAGKVRIVERANAATLLKEQDFGASNRVKQGTGARVGQILGAQLYLMGDIVAFGRDDRKTGVTLGTLGFGGALAGVRIGSKSEKAIVVINYRLVDAETSEVIDTGEARGESKRTSKGLGGIFGSSSGVAGGGIDMASSNFAETIIGEAVMDVADKLTAILNSKASSVSVKQSEVEARVADVTGQTVTIAAGSNAGIAVGDRFDVFRIISEIKDPVTGEVLDSNVSKLGELVITSVRERIASGQYTGGAVTAKDGLVRRVIR
jgi:curli biogenesis system outer membrane secretion channel CsgG